MANTTYLDLKKPTLDDDALIADINDNMDKVDAAVQEGSEAIAIVSLGNTHGAIAAGQYVYVRGHSSLAEGLYTANSAIAANATLSSSNVTAVSGGGLNALNDKIAKVVQTRNATGTVTCQSLATADVDFTLNAAFTNNPQTYVCALVGSTNLYPVTIRSWSDGTHCNIRIFNVGNTTATSVSLTISILGFSGGVND